jgi:fructuronate reductase
LRADIVVPGYDIRSVGVGIVHLGIGNFHRAHQAVYTDEAMRRSGGNWGICGVSLRSGAVRDRLAPQDGLYTLVEVGSEHRRFRVVGAVRELLVAPEDPAAVIARLADPTVSVVTLTVTEKGYCLDAAGELDLGHPDIAADLAEPGKPRSAIGYLVAGLGSRAAEDAGGLTIVSCDNLAGNGRLLKAAVLTLAACLDSDLARWIELNCRFPATVVDRIVPATEPWVADAVAESIGLEDTAPVIGEPFSQWVIEADFAGPIPSWDRVGAEFVDDVAPYEEMKLRLLNASHSAIAYLGCLAGWSTVADAMSEPAVASYVSELMAREVEPVLAVPPGFDVQAYRGRLLERFSNTALDHRTRQIAMDGSQKLPHRVLPTLATQLAGAGEWHRLALAVAAWIRYTRGIDRAGGTYQVDDPLAERLAAIHRAAGHDPHSYVPAVLSGSGVFDGELAGSEALTACLVEQVRRLDVDVTGAVLETLA